jgi:membrane protease YdiL (CAAX protease family)
MVLNHPAQQRQPVSSAAERIIVCSSRAQSKTPTPVPQANIPNHKTYDDTTASAGDNFTHHSFLMDIVTGIGAGIYEELIFRLVLIGLLMLFFETILGIERTKAIAISVLVSAILFSLHHHFVFLNGKFERAELLTMTPFIFRTIAGAYFAVVFAVRGFGVVAGAHIFYDIIATILNVWLFGQY